MVAEDIVRISFKDICDMAPQNKWKVSYTGTEI